MSNSAMTGLKSTENFSLSDSISNSVDRNILGYKPLRSSSRMKISKGLYLRSHALATKHVTTSQDHFSAIQ
jgi:hypothetical protein